MINNTGKLNRNVTQVVMFYYPFISTRLVSGRGEDDNKHF